MKNRVWGLVWGLLFIAAGLGFAGNAFGLWHFELFFDGWWTLFIILPCAASLLQNGPNAGAFAGLAVGALLLLSAQDILPWHLVRRMLLPVVLVLIGLQILYRHVFCGGARPEEDAWPGPGPGSGGASGFCAVFCGREERVAGRFEGAGLTAVFGGGTLDLRDALIDRDVFIDATAIFGGIDICLPAGVRARVNCTPILGGVENKRREPPPEAACPTVYIRATCVFGGIDIK